MGSPGERELTLESYGVHVNTHTNNIKWQKERPGVPVSSKESKQYCISSALEDEAGESGIQ